MNHLKELRMKHGYTQNDIATLLGISRSAYTNIENNKREPDFNTLSRLSNIFKVSADYLLDRYSGDWDKIELPPKYSDAYNSICTILLNLCRSFGQDDIAHELRKKIQIVMNL